LKVYYLLDGHMVIVIQLASGLDPKNTVRLSFL
jgi:hypothetical protein